MFIFARERTAYFELIGPYTISLRSIQPTKAVGGGTDIQCKVAAAEDCHSGHKGYRLYDACANVMGV